MAVKSVAGKADSMVASTAVSMAAWKAVSMAVEMAFQKGAMMEPLWAGSMNHVKAVPMVVEKAVWMADLKVALMVE